MQTEKAGCTILVVDDDPPILQAVRRVLEQADYVVLTSPSGDHAWNLVKRGHARVDLVLTDIVMPGSLDGFALAVKVRQRELKPPVLFMTGALPEDDESAAEIAKKGLMLRKPFSPKQLLEFIDSHLFGPGLGE
jgi:DNA-binding response OmpR family regulator